jgi:hypothetical protein
MGTNYYWYEKAPCGECKREFESVHIGKSSVGWNFSLRVHPDLGINSLSDWEERWGSGEIKDEYGRIVSPEGMKATITERSHPGGLLRHTDGTLCIGHGEGTWDLMLGEFS